MSIFNPSLTIYFSSRSVLKVCVGPVTLQLVKRHLLLGAPPIRDVSY